MRRTMQMSISNDPNSMSEDDDKEEELIKYYFYRGYEYKDILDFLSTYHNADVSERTLHKRLRLYGFSRKNPQYDVNAIMNEI